MDFMNGNRQQPPAEWLTAPGPEKQEMNGSLRAESRVGTLILDHLERAYTSHQITSHQAPEPSCDWPDFTPSRLLNGLSEKPLLHRDPPQVQEASTPVCVLNT